MADVPERLFRDDAGAAFERVARLEQENQQLRAELRRFHRPDEVPTLRTRRSEKPNWTFFIAGIGMALVMLGGAVAGMTAARPPRPPTFVHTFPPPVAPGLIGVSTPGTATPIVTIADAEDCDTPYTYDEQGVKHYKQRCIHPERVQR